ncbi:MAG: cobalt transporter CbiM [Thermoleophilia bacterium]|nr:cobalt transporter CbiM [Thermoleophilia bacterium]
MHIPDGYISPQTAGGLWALMVPVWYTAGYKAKRLLKARQAPLVAIGAAFTFVIMMFNIPVPGGTTGHAIGGTLVAVVLGPWTAVIALTVALVIQALFFGDGGLLALGANCLNIGFAMPVAGYYVYRVFSLGAAPGSARQWLAAGVGAYAGINVAAFLTAVQIGIQGDFFQTAAGAALYSPYGLSQAVPAMMAAHLTLVGFVEAAVTSLVVLYLQRTNPGLLLAAAESKKARAGGQRLKPLAIGLLLMIVFVPLGLLASAPAWGEWGPEEIREELGFIPEGMERFAGLWSGILPDYALPGDGGEPWAGVAAYVFSAILGLGIVSLLTYVIVRLTAGKDVRK